MNDFQRRMLAFEFLSVARENDIAQGLVGAVHRSGRRSFPRGEILVESFCLEKALEQERGERAVIRLQQDRSAARLQDALQFIKEAVGMREMMKAVLSVQHADRAFAQ